MTPIAEKIIKLLKLSQNNSNPHEAAAAYAQAQRLVAKHNLDEALLQGEDSNPSSFVKEVLFQGKRKSVWKSRLGAALARSNNCFIWTARVHSNEFAMMLAGTQSEIEITKYMFDSLTHQIEVMCKTFMKARSMGRNGAKSAANSFKLGAVTTVSNHLQAALKEIQVQYQGTTALAVVNNRVSEAREWVEREFKLVSSKNYYKANLDDVAYSQGIEAGRNVKIRKALQ